MEDIGAMIGRIRELFNVRKEVNTAINESTMRCYGHKYKLKRNNKESVWEWTNLCEKGG